MPVKPRRQASHSTLDRTTLQATYGHELIVLEGGGGAVTIHHHEHGHEH